MPVMSAFLTMRGFSAPTVTLSRHFEEQGPRANGARKIGYPKPYQGRVLISVFPRSRQFHQFPVRRFVTVLRLEIGGQFKKSLSDATCFRENVLCRSAAVALIPSGTGPIRPSAFKI